MGLGAFKALGGIYAVAQLIAGDIKLASLTQDELRARAANKTFVCASAGNHGMAVAAGAAHFGARARVHLSTAVPWDFETRLVAKNAVVLRSGATYAQSVAAAVHDAKTNRYIHLADGSWPGYTAPPRLIMEGYTVMAEEMRHWFQDNKTWPTHVFLQAGVGGMAAAIAYMIRNNWAVQPKIIIVEPETAPCLRESARAGHLVTVTGAESNMGRLDCKSASMLAFEILRSAADHFVMIDDATAQDATNELSALGVATTPSGAAGYGAMMAFDLPTGANPLVIVSEGAVSCLG